MAASRARVLSGYRRVLRAAKDLFQGDDFALQQSRTALKDEFRKNRGAAANEAHFAAIDEAEHMLRHEFVRGKLNEDTGHYGAW
jgi:complex III assembly factor LYRM7